jgi:DNA mismatch endonuclease (patch repair protein)
MDTVDSQTRSQIMARVGQKNTGAEMMLRRALHRRGLRYRLHDRSLPGSPDIVFPRFKSVLFVHGCYWHSHGCYRSKIPKSSREFWTNKFETNRTRDERSRKLLVSQGWRVLTVWECALRGKLSSPVEDVADAVWDWLASKAQIGEIEGRPAEPMPIVVQS